MKIFTIHSPSHEIYFRNMFESLRLVGSKHTLHSKIVRQVCDPNFGSSDVKRFYFLKVIYILELLYQEDEPFIFSDVDCYFFKDFHLDLGRYYDFFAQYEKQIYGRHTVCSGFMLLKPNNKTRKMFTWILKNLHRFNGDQEALNAYLFLHPFTMKYKMLPKTFYSINFDNGDKVWNGEHVDVTIEDMIMIHLHWTIGEENRTKLLEMVKEQVNDKGKL